MSCALNDPLHLLSRINIPILIFPTKKVLNFRFLQKLWGKETLCLSTIVPFRYDLSLNIWVTYKLKALIHSFSNMKMFLFICFILFCSTIPSAYSSTCDAKNEETSMNWHVENNKLEIHFEHNNLTENRWTSITFGNGPGMVSFTFRIYNVMSLNHKI